MGIEPMTSSLPRKCSTPELRGQTSLLKLPSFRFQSLSVNRPLIKNGAGNGIRTRDPELGRLALYQLSYSRTRQNTSPSLLVERGGFEPPKVYTVRFTV